MAECGTRQGYRKGCRCESCTKFGELYLAEKREREARYRANVKKRVAAGEKVVITHGYGGYTRGCRCTDCVTDYRRIRNERRAKSLVEEAPELDWSILNHLRPGLNRPTQK